MLGNMCVLVLVLGVVFVPVVRPGRISDNAISRNPSPKSGRTLFLDGARRRCPLCDSSVFSYCSDKLFHDSCCCNNPHNQYYPLPPQCQFADCSFLHANTCQEHKLITACCCINHI